MSSILIQSQDENCNLEKIILWNHAFAETCELIFDPLLRRFENTLFVNFSNVTIVQKKGNRYRLSKSQIYNPVYSIYYQNILFAEIFCEVGGFETYYQIIYNTSFTDCKIFVKHVEIISKFFPLDILEIIFSF
jgi:hypothetical protein